MMAMEACKIMDVIIVILALLFLFYCCHPYRGD